MTLWSRVLARSRDKLKSFFDYHCAYGHQTWQDVNLPWWAPAHKVTSRGLVRSHGKLESQKNPRKTQKIGTRKTQCLWHQTWQDSNLPSWTPAYKVHDHWIMWSCEITWQPKIISPLPKCLWPPTWQAVDLPWGASTHNVTPPIAYIVLPDNVKK